MGLQTQILTLLYSFLYGIIFLILLTINDKALYQSKKWIRIVITFFFVLTNVLLYFLILKMINQGVIHPYAILMIVIGYLCGDLIMKKFEVRKRSSNLIEKIKTRFHCK